MVKLYEITIVTKQDTLAGYRIAPLEYSGSADLPCW